MQGFSFYMYYKQRVNRIYGVKPFYQPNLNGRRISFNYKTIKLKDNNNILLIFSFDFFFFCQFKTICILYKLFFFPFFCLSKDHKIINTSLNIPTDNVWVSGWFINTSVIEIKCDNNHRVWCWTKSHLVLYSTSITLMLLIH